MNHVWLKCESRVAVSAGTRSEEAEFLVVQGRGVPLLGRKTATQLGVLKIGVGVAAVSDVASTLKLDYPEVFNGIGKLNSRKITLHIDPDVKPVAQPLRRIPFNLRSKVDDKINELIAHDIIEEVDGPTPWVNPVVIVPKSNSSDIRLCIDMRRANEAIIRGRYPIPTVDELLQNMNGSKVFSKIDLKWGYHQLELTEESRDITTFATHSGLYRYKRLLFGVSSASEQYQHEIAAALAWIEGVENISDDIVIHAPDEETHNERLHAVMQRLSRCGLTVNGAKCQFNLNGSSSWEYSCHRKELGQQRIESRRWWKRGNQKMHQRYAVSSEWYATAAGSSRSSHRYPNHSGGSQKSMNRLCLETNKSELSSY